VFSIGAINAELGFMLHDLEEANLARVAAARAQVKIVVADHDKFNKRAPISIGKDIEFDVFYTDAQPPKAIMTILEEMDIDLVVVD
jgi:DeoR family glycerol-3-phosphate regulon repressor